MNARWWWIAGLGGLAMAQWGLGYDARPDATSAEMWPAAAEARRSLQREILATARRIQATRLVERYSRRAVEALERGAVIDTAPDAEGVAAAERATARLAAWGLEAPAAAVGVHRPGSEGWPDGVPQPPGTRLVRVAAGRTSDGRAWCLQFSDSPPDGYGACWPWARYGAPGPHVAEWMRATGFEAARIEKASTLADELDDTWLRRSVALGLRPTMGLSGRAPVLAERCLGNQREACEELFLLPVTDELYVDEAWTPLFGVRANFLPGDFLHDLEERHGPERMAAFWTSDADVVTAFERAFDADLTETMGDLGRERFGAGTPGPTVAGWGWIGLLVALGAGLMGSAVVEARRTIA